MICHDSKLVIAQARLSSSLYVFRINNSFFGTNVTTYFIYKKSNNHDMYCYCHHNSNICQKNYSCRENFGKRRLEGMK